MDDIYLLNLALIFVDLQDLALVVLLPLHWLLLLELFGLGLVGDIVGHEEDHELLEDERIPIFIALRQEEVTELRNSLMSQCRLEIWLMLISNWLLMRKNCRTKTKFMRSLEFLLMMVLKMAMQSGYTIYCVSIFLISFTCLLASSVSVGSTSWVSIIRFMRLFTSLSL